METYTKRCECGNLFIPIHQRQCRCIPCILGDDPPPAPHDTGDGNICNDFIEWFIYHWHNVRAKAAQLKGIPFDWDDGVIDDMQDDFEDGDRQTISQLFIEHGIKPNTGFARLSRGWTLDEALAGKRERDDK